MAEDASAEGLNIGVLLYLPYRAMDLRVNEAATAAGFGDTTPAQLRIFQRIAPEGSRLTDLAEQAQVTKQTAGILVDQLERLGYVERTADPHDRRARLIRITERGHASIAVARAAIAEIEAEWAAHLGSERMSQLRGTLTALREIANPERSSASRGRQ
ncbi:MarR family winged helix-turn-helix transcriptional regulator [Pseudonocardia hispaniensis]|uniref:MarR family winged helix-turn-helix transcriptional regulator n=1 Tax=Pseudonocardia hispaniensis TaxID=904933 RepID=A0ABW1J4P2_9PSEU